MPNETLIAEIENMLSEIIRLGGENERSQVVPNLTVQDANPSGLDGFIIVSDDRDGDNIVAKKVGSVIYADNDLVNVLFPLGGEAIAFQQGSQSTNSGIWEIVANTSTDIYYDKGDVGIGKSIAPDAALEILDTAQAQLRLTHTEDTKFADFTLDTNHDLTVDPSSTGQIILASDDVVIQEDLIHSGDTDTKIIFTDDDIELQAGGLSLLKLTEAAQDLITLGPGSGDVDINFNGDAFLQGSSGRLGVGTVSPISAFHSFSGGIAATFEREVGTSGLASVATFLRSSTGVPVDGFGGRMNFQIESDAGTNRTVATFDFIATDITDASMDGAFAISTRENLGAVTERMRVAANGDIMIGSSGSPLAQLHVDQESTTAAQPVLSLDQADLSEEFINFIATIGAGNPIDTAAIGTYYGKIRVAVNGTFKYMALYNS